MNFELQFFIVAIVFTFMGWWMGCDFMARRIVALTIDNLIEDDFIQVTVNEKGETVLMKWYEEHE